MALPSSGQITMNQMHIEAGGSSGTMVGMNDSDMRTLAGKSSGQIKASDFHGKSSALTLSGTGTYYFEYGSYGSTFDGLRTRATGNASYPFIGIVREPYTGSTYYHMIQGVQVAATLNSATFFKVAYGNGAYNTVSGVTWSNYSYSNGKVITYATGGSYLASTIYSGLSGANLYYQFGGI